MPIYNGRATDQQHAEYAGSQYAAYQSRKQQEKQQEQARKLNEETKWSPSQPAPPTSSAQWISLLIISWLRRLSKKNSVCHDAQTLDLQLN